MNVLKEKVQSLSNTANVRSEKKLREAQFELDNFNSKQKALDVWLKNMNQYSLPPRPGKSKTADLEGKRMTKTPLRVIRKFVEDSEHVKPPLTPMKTVAIPNSVKKKSNKMSLSLLPPLPPIFVDKRE